MTSCFAFPDTKSLLERVYSKSLKRVYSKNLKRVYSKSLKRVYSESLKRIYTKRKDFAPTWSKFLSFRVDPYSEGE